MEAAITRDEIRRFINSGVIRVLPEKGVSRSRARLLHEKRKKGRKRGPGGRSGKETARQSDKEDWMARVRAIREALRGLKAKRALTKSVYRELYLRAKGGAFKDPSSLKEFIEARRLARRR